MSEQPQSSSGLNTALPIIAGVIIVAGLLLLLFGFFFATALVPGPSVSSSSSSFTATGGSGGASTFATDGKVNKEYHVAMHFVFAQYDDAGKPLCVVVGIDTAASTSDITQLAVVDDAGAVQYLPLPGSDFLRIVTPTGVTVLTNPIPDAALGKVIEQAADGSRDLSDDLAKLKTPADVDAMIKAW
ncbi:MAG: hypothetical protein GC162_08825 [Planctomycetes bacterium]|nr:hypothetical protein [Planctomycetota bacterium]